MGQDCNEGTVRPKVNSVHLVVRNTGGECATQLVSVRHSW